MKWQRTKSRVIPQNPSLQLLEHMMHVPTSLANSIAGRLHRMDHEGNTQCVIPQMSIWNACVCSFLEAREHVFYLGINMADEKPDLFFFFMHSIL